MMVLAMLLAIPASASSIFPAIPTAMIEEAPSYGVLMDLEPQMEETLFDGSVRHTYGGVTQESFNAYGVLLNERGYTLPSYEYVDSSLVAQVVKDSIAFQITFDWTAGTLKVVYPEGVKYEVRKVANPFEGYMPVEMGQTVKFKGFVEMTLSDFAEYKSRYRDCTYVLKTSCKNISTVNTKGGRIFWQQYYSGSGPIHATVHYLNSDAHYTWACTHYNEYDSLISVMTSGNAWACFEIPGSVVNAEDGILAITLEKGEEKFVIYLRGGVE